MRSRARSQKKSAKAQRKKSAKKVKVPSAKEKSANFALFLSPTVEIRFQSPKPLGRGKARVLSKMYSSVGMLKLCPILAVLFWLSCPFLFVKSCLGNPNLPVLSCLSCSACPFLPVLLFLSYSACPVLPILFCLSQFA